MTVRMCLDENRKEILLMTVSILLPRSMSTHSRGMLFTEFSQSAEWWIFEQKPSPRPALDLPHSH